MIFLNLLLFVFLSMESSSRNRILNDISNPAHIESKMRFSFSMPSFIKPLKTFERLDTKYTWDEQIIIFDSDETIKKILTEKNALNDIIAHYCSKNTYLVNNSIVYLQIGSLSNTNPYRCTMMKNQDIFYFVETIKKLNTNDEFEIEDKKGKDPFNLSESIHALQMTHLEALFTKSYPLSIILSAISSFIMLACNKSMPTIPTATFFIPFLANYQYMYFYLKITFTEMSAKNNKLSFFALVSLLFVAPAFVIYGTNVLAHCIKQKILA